MTTLKEQEEKLRQEWRTPPDLIAAVQSEFCFDLDVAASADNAVTPSYLNEDFDGLARPWFGEILALLHPAYREGEGADEHGLAPLLARTVWCNPGFSGMGRWVDKAIVEVAREPRATAVLIGLVAPSTKWWGRAVEAGAEIRLLSPRVQFVAPPGIKQTTNPRESALLIFRALPVGSPRPAHIWRWRWKEMDSGLR